MTELTDRYIFAAARNLPAAQREEFSRELAERIGDAIDARVDSGASAPEAAEHDALAELGNPSMLAADYTDRPLMLIGPGLYLIWKRLLILLESIVPPIVAAAVLLASLIEGRGWGSIGPAIGIAITVGVHVAFWTTLVFAAIERTDGGKKVDLGWAPDQLPQLPDVVRPHRRSDLVASLVYIALMLGFIVWQQFGGLVIEAEWMPVLDPALWSFWLPVIIGLLVVEAAFAVWIYLRDWSWPAAVANVAIGAAFAVPVLWLFGEGRLFSPELEAFAGANIDDDGMRALGAVFVLVIVGVAVWDAIDGIVKAARGGGRGTLEFPGNRS
ncbi:permease prefix domain 1-containing protein [Agromyces archimandritae]|uniref:Uncharacterized protein n=1 Tax=Agromyces archimandritae TaxID=2781962 RepID=A0A975FNC6_9MICO|nr:permease prefix domain 1-containing protein [Agromyces archimandritae]QTX05350.1 hypothetical protein G127AT_03740 [Agromyces archimandritae]